MEKYLLKIPTLVNLQTNLISCFHFFHFHTFIVTFEWCNPYICSRRSSSAGKFPVDEKTERPVQSSIKIIFWQYKLAQFEKCPNTKLFLVRNFLHSDWNLRIQSEYWKLRTRNKTVFGHFSRCVTKPNLNLMSQKSFLQDIN